MSGFFGEEDPAPFDLVNIEGKAPILLTCEHAGLAVPESLGRLGMDDGDFGMHFAYDIGVRELTLRLSELLDAPAILGNYSRMVADLGRRENDSAFPTVGEGKPIPGNQGLSAEDKEERFAHIYRPYHDKVVSLLDDHFLARDIIPIVLSIHSFTPVFHGEKRPWDIGFLWVQDGRVPEPLMKYFEAHDYVVGDNEPYNLRIVRGTTVDRHADTRGLANAMIEFRHDLLRHDDDIERNAQLLCDGMKDIMKNPEVFSVYDGPEIPYDPELAEAYIVNILKTVT